MKILFLAIIFSLNIKQSYSNDKVNLLPLVLNTWPFTNATNRAYESLIQSNGNALDSVELGCNICEVEQCDGTVGYGGSPDSTGETTLDAMIMNGKNRAVGAVGYLRQVKDAIKVARAVLEHSSHSLLVGEGAMEFARMMGFKIETLSTKASTQIYNDWRQNKCQPNYFRNVYDQKSSCPPYKPIDNQQQHNMLNAANENVDYDNHDTIGMVAISANKDVASGTSSNGANHKIAGRVGDAPIAGAGSYADNDVGGAAATGDGDIMMRFLPSYQAVMNMRNGMSPKQACEAALLPIIKFYPDFKGGIVCANIDGEFGAAGYGWIFSYSIRNPTLETAQIRKVPPLQPAESLSQQDNGVV